MKNLNLKITVTFLTFSFGFVSVWSFGGFSYLNSFFKDCSSTLLTVPEVSQTPLKFSLDKTERTFIKRELRFEDYPVATIYKGKTAKLRLPKNDFIDQDWFQWVVENTEVDFAGHYILSNKSCGMWCSSVDIIDAKTGRIYRIDVSPEVCFPHLDNEFDCSEDFPNIDYRIDSNLLVLFGFRFSSAYDHGEKGFHYYKFKNGKFTHLKSILVKDQRSARQVQLAEFDEKNE